MKKMNRPQILPRPLYKPISIIRRFISAPLDAKLVLLQYALAKLTGNKKKAMVAKLTFASMLYRINDPMLYQVTKRGVADAPVVHMRPSMAVFARKNTAHFLDPVLESVKGDIEIHRYYDEGSLVAELAAMSPDIPFQVIDSSNLITYPRNVTVRPYTERPYNELLEDTKVLLLPVTDDGCGTSRVAIEAQLLGIPVLSVAKSGIPEVVPGKHLLPHGCDVTDWTIKLRDILAFYDANSKLARESISWYSEETELEKIEMAVLGVLEQCGV